VLSQVSMLPGRVITYYTTMLYFRINWKGALIREMVKTTIVHQ